MTEGIHARLQLAWPGFRLAVDLDLPATGVTAIFGHSGSGKTSLLRCIAGLARAPGGLVRFQGESWQEGNHFVPTHRRPIGYVFQEASLFPHLSARGNLDFARRRADRGRPAIDLDQAVDLLGIRHLLDRLPAQLSGGERQRVAIARALLINPRLLLMDEPLAALDQARKGEILPYLENLRRELALPILYVSHSAEEVARLGDHLVAMAEGQVLASGPLGETLSRLDFPIKLGEDTGVVVEATITARDATWHLAEASFAGGALWLRDTGHALGERVRVRVLARDISLALSRHDDSSIVNVLPARVLEIAEDAAEGLALVRLAVGDTALVARLTRRSAHLLELAPGKAVWAQIKSVAVIQ
ncbi:MAG: molybdenum ABC transporter ATP-binding protein [Porticoccaceae bacterium]|jgi:molybdate transport system ATP-binding protein|nr:molybdenum ABC transporter ATP-binding protein [Porticoccaceae bacterium]MEA3301088.1 molybdenum ABC transporter ATP-binding protein [Pseudomonadota bacterium]HLS98167.1 molybdenum ABC transporter ATP-binding protein [Porticoccaceae bacterium]